MMEPRTATFFKFELGAKVRDRISGFVGIVTERVESSFCGPRYGVVPDGNGLTLVSPLSALMDEARLEAVEG